MTNAAERFISPGRPPEGRTREIIEIIIEECAEIQQRATKALRFGLNEVQPGQTFTNAYRMGGEVGDLLEVVDMAIREGVFSEISIADGRASKQRQLARYMQHQPG